MLGTSCARGCLQHCVRVGWAPSRIGAYGLLVCSRVGVGDLTPTRGGQTAHMLGTSEPCTGLRTTLTPERGQSGEIIELKELKTFERIRFVDSTQLVRLDIPLRSIFKPS